MPEPQVRLVMITVRGQPAEAEKACNALQELVDRQPAMTEMKVCEANPDKPAPEQAIEIEELEFSTRSYNCLKAAGINNVGELTSRSESELLGIPRFGQVSLVNVKQVLTARGLNLKEG